MAFRRTLALMLLVLGFVALVCVSVAIYAVLSPSPVVIHLEPPPADQADARASQAERDYEQIKTKLDYAEKQSSHIQSTVAALVTIAAIYAIALGLAAYINLKQTLETGKEELHRLAEYRESIRAQFPALGEMDNALVSILSRSLAVLRIRTADWRKTLFAGLDETEKQEVALAEFTAGAFDFFSLDKVATYGQQVSEIYHRLGRFYGSRSVLAAHGPQSTADLCRSILYFKKALAYTAAAGSQKSGILADLGLMSLEKSYPASLNEEQKKMHRAEAEHWFSDSLAERDQQPVALLALAWIERRDKSIQAAIDRLTRLINTADAADAESRRFVRKAHFNRACYICLEHQTGGHLDGQWLSRAVDDLRNARTLVEAEDWDEWLEQLASNLREDLAPIETQAADAVQELKTRPVHPPNTDEHKSLLRAVGDAIKTWWRE